MQIIILYSLKDGVSHEDFHHWVRHTDYPAMRAVSRIENFRTLHSHKQLMGDERPSAEYVEIFDIADLDGFLNEDLPSAEVMGVMEQFLGFAETPEFIIAEEI